MTSPGGRSPAVARLAPDDVPDIEQVALLVRSARILWDARHIDGHVLPLGQVLNGG
jgi:hypothetical protein